MGKSLGPGRKKLAVIRHWSLGIRSKTFENRVICAKH